MAAIKNCKTKNAIASAIKIQKPRKDVKPKLHATGIFMGFKRSRCVQRVNSAIIQIEGLKTREDTAFYIGKEIRYVYHVFLPSHFSFTSQTPSSLYVHLMVSLIAISLRPPLC